MQKKSQKFHFFTRFKSFIFTFSLSLTNIVFILTRLKVMQSVTYITTPKPPLIIKLIISGRKFASRLLTNEVIASVGKESSVNSVKSFKILILMPSFLLIIKMFKIIVIVVLTPMPNGSDKTPI